MNRKLPQVKIIVESKQSWEKGGGQQAEIFHAIFEMKLLNKLSYQIFKMLINIYQLDITWNMHKPVEKSCGTDFLLGIYSVVDWPYIWEWKEALGLWEGRQWEKMLRKGPALILTLLSSEMHWAPLPKSFASCWQFWVQLSAFLLFPD